MSERDREEAAAAKRNREALEAIRRLEAKKLPEVLDAEWHGLTHRPIPLSFCSGGLPSLGKRR
jgi:hypothetical protein